MKKFNPMLLIQHVRELWYKYADIQEVLDEAGNSVENQNTTQPNIMFWTGTQAEYDLITEPNPDTLYYIKP